MKVPDTETLDRVFSAFQPSTSLESQGDAWLKVVAESQIAEKLSAIASVLVAASPSQIHVLESVRNLLIVAVTVGLEAGVALAECEKLENLLERSTT